MTIDECCDTSNPQYQWIGDFVREFEYIIIVSSEWDDQPVLGSSAIDWCSERIGNFARIKQHRAVISDELWSFGFVPHHCIFAFSKVAPLNTIIEFKLKFG